MLESFIGKFRLHSEKKNEYNQTARNLEFIAVCNDGTEENKRFHKYTPSGNINILVDNPLITDDIELGREYYVEFHLIPKVEKKV